MSEYIFEQNFTKDSVWFKNTKAESKIWYKLIIDELNHNRFGHASSHITNKLRAIFAGIILIEIWWDLLGVKQNDKRMRIDLNFDKNKEKPDWARTVTNHRIRTQNDNSKRTSIVIKSERMADEIQSYNKNSGKSSPAMITPRSTS